MGNAHSLPSLPILAIYHHPTESIPLLGWIVGFTTDEDECYAIFIVKDSGDILEKNIKNFQVDVEWFADQHLFPMTGTEING